MWGLIRWFNPAYPLGKILSPFVRSPTKSFALVGKPVAEAAAALSQRNKETITLPVGGDLEGEVTVTVPYDQETLDKILAISILPQVMLLSATYAIPEVQRDLNILWRTMTLKKAGALPKWNGVRALFTRKARLTLMQRAALIKGGSQVGARVGGSFIPFLNIAIWIDTGILAVTGVADLLISEEVEQELGIDLQPVSPIGEVINGLAKWVGDQLGITQEEIIRASQEVGLDRLAQAGFAAVGDLVIDEESITIETDLKLGIDKEINLDLDGHTLGETLGLAFQMSIVNEATNLNWGKKDDMLNLFLILIFSLTLIAFGRQFLRYIRGV